MKNSIYAQNNEAEKEAYEYQKYGRAMNQQLVAVPHTYSKHSIEPMYGNYDAPISGIYY